MSGYLGLLLAGSAFIVGFWLYGWQGLVLAVSMTAFWLLLQFSRTMRLMRRAAERPLGLVPSAVMLQAKLQHGMNLQEVIGLTGSLGEKVGEPDDWRWHDNAGNEVVVCLRRGRVVRWYLGRPDGGAADGVTAPDPVRPPSQSDAAPPDLPELPAVDALGYPLDPPPASVTPSRPAPGASPARDAPDA